MSHRNRFRPAMAILAAASLFCGAAAADDTALFSATVPPNVVLLVDNSGSMAHIVWHEAYDPTASYSCNETNGGWANPDSTGYSLHDVTITRCGRTRTYYVDPELEAQGVYTRFSFRYLNWLHSLPDGDPILAEIAASNNGTFSSCLGGGSFHKYKRSRVTAAKHILREVICQVNASGAVRFGLAQFRKGSDPTGGYLAVPVEDYTPTHAAAIDAFIDDLSPEAWTPLGETLFQVYTYFMSRDDDDRPVGVDGSTKFPKYAYSTSESGAGGAETSSPPDSPVQYACQKNFVVVITDGEPTKDDFDDSPGSTSKGFEDFDKLIGDFNPDNASPEDPSDPVPEEPGSIPTCTNCESALYLDDIALFMQQRNFRPDMATDEAPMVIDTYTVGFTTSDFANQLLQKTADVGNGQFYFSNDAESLANSIVAALTDIIEKSQSFTAATVPASRTVDGGQIYISFFIPSSQPGIWEGHLKSFEFTSSGDVLDLSGQCVADEGAGGDQLPPCDNGPLRTNAVGYWDAADGIPPSASRALFTSRVGGASAACETLAPAATSSGCEDFTTAELGAADLGVVAGDLTRFPDSQAGPPVNDVELLADEVVEWARGCDFGSSPCTERTPRLGDVFHSNPLVVAAPNAPINDLSYLQFAVNYAKRKRVLYAGSNDGFLHAFHAGDFQESATPPAHDVGTGQELFGFMPYSIRQIVKEIPIDAQPRDYYGVDGSPQVADVWLPSTPTATSKAADEWHTVLLGGLREGGRTYYALDVTNPGDGLGPPLPPPAPGYPSYLWEFPCEDAVCDSIRPYMGETWSEPVVTRVRLAIDGDDNGGVGYERFVAIFAGGYDAAGDPNAHASYDASDDATTSRAGRALFMVDVATGRIVGVKKYEHNAVDPDEREMRYALASTPAVFDLDFDGFADVVYVGDLGGNVWKWVIRDVGLFSAAPDVGIDPASHDASQPQWEFRRWFSAPVHTEPAPPASTGLSYYKSIFFPPTGTLKNGTLYLGFGTGERENLEFEGFPGDADNNRYYVVIDADPYERLSPPLPPLGEPDLQNADLASDCSVVESAGGYYLVAEESEKFIANSIIFLGDIWTVSFVPTNDSDPCTAGGVAYLYRFSLTCAEGGFFKGTPSETRRQQIGTGLGTVPRISVGPPDADPDPACQTKVYVITSEGGLTTECGGSLPTGGVKVHNWRQR